MSETVKMLLGSGKIYCAEVAEDQAYTRAAIAALKTEANRLGHVSGGATLEYKPTIYQAKDDLGEVGRTILTEEDATLKTGLCTFSPERLKKLVSTGRVSTEENTTVLKIGGIGNFDGKSYVLIFEHEEKADNVTIDIVIRGQNQNGISLAFAKDKETVIDAEFKCLPMDETGTLIQYMETPITTAS